jgi:uncharacterized protein
MNIVITGATGFIGRRLAAKLSGDGHTVVGLSRDPARAASAAPEIASFYPWTTEALPPPAALEPADAVIHLAGETVNGRWTASKKRRILESRELGTRNLVAALSQLGSGKALVSASAVGYYGDRGDTELTEGSGPGKGFLADVTQAWEREAVKAETLGMRVAVLRLGIVLGSEGGALGALLPLFRAGLGGPLGTGRQWWPWVHVDDVAGALEGAAANQWTGVFNVTAPQPVRQRDFAKAVAAALHRPALVQLPAFALRLGLGEFADELLFSKRVLPARLQQAGFQFQYEDAAQAVRQIVSPRSR